MKAHADLLSSFIYVSKEAKTFIRSDCGGKGGAMRKFHEVKQEEERSEEV